MDSSSAALAFGSPGPRRAAQYQGSQHHARTHPLPVPMPGWLPPGAGKVPAPVWASLPGLALLQRVQVAFPRATTQETPGVHFSALKVCIQVPGSPRDPSVSSSQAGDVQVLCKLQENPCPAALNPAQGELQDNQKSMDTTTGATAQGGQGIWKPPEQSGTPAM